MTNEQALSISLILMQEANVSPDAEKSKASVEVKHALRKALGLYLVNPESTLMEGIKKNLDGFS